MVPILLSPAFVGLAGAFVYAAPRLSTCIFASRQAGTGWSLCLIEFGLALATGMIAAAYLTPWICASVLKSTDAGLLRPVAVTIGLLANPIAPRIVDILGGRILNILKGPDK